MSKSVKRVQRAAEAAGLNIELRRLGEDTKTAAAAAAALGIEVGRIAKSLVFFGQSSGELVLLLVSGTNRACLDRAAAAAGEALVQASPQEVRQRSGFVIGGVAPLGHLEPPRVYIDETLEDFSTVWAAGGAPDAVFEITPKDLIAATGGQVVDLAEQEASA